MGWLSRHSVCPACLQPCTTMAESSIPSAGMGTAFRVLSQASPLDTELGKNIGYKGFNEKKCIFAIFKIIKVYLNMCMVLCFLDYVATLLSCGFRELLEHFCVDCNFGFLIIINQKRTRCPDGRWLIGVETLQWAWVVQPTMEQFIKHWWIFPCNTKTGE